jgi:hypothetical protein
MVDLGTLRSLSTVAKPISPFVTARIEDATPSLFHLLHHGMKCGIRHNLIHDSSLGIYIIINNCADSLKNTKIKTSYTPEDGHVGRNMSCKRRN